MIGFHHSSHADVNLITDNLRDRYKDLFSILKELVQNADDACAGRLRFGITRGDSESPHELLRGPGLVVVNDGEFRPSDYEAICSFGLNSKAGDAATIGKFGLGMKSVFHLCEAIFFMGGGDGFAYQELLSPWGKDYRPDWDLPEPQQSQLFASLRRDCLVAVQWNPEWAPFILCLPLRREEHLRLPGGQLAKAIIEDITPATMSALVTCCSLTTPARGSPHCYRCFEACLVSRCISPRKAKNRSSSIAVNWSRIRPVRSDNRLMVSLISVGAHEKT